MQLENYISDLLYRYDCVTIPGLGAFLTNRVSAKIHESTKTFYPPKKVLSFNEQIQHNDGLLINYIAEIEKLPFSTTKSNLAKQVSAIKSYLQQGETITFHNIGELQLNTDGHIIFNPSYHINYLTDAFGLSHFNSKDVSRIVYKDTVEAVEKVVPIAITPEKRKSKPWLKYAAAAVLLFGLVGVAGVSYYENTVKNHNQLAHEEADTLLDTKVQEATFFISNPLPTATLAIEKVNKGNYHIVGGAFRIEANANKKVAQLKALGFNARKVGKNKYGLYQVVYESYQTKREAESALFKIKRTQDAAAWLWVKALH